MELVDFAGRIDRAIRRKLQPKIDSENNQFTDLTSFQKENIIHLYTEFVQVYEGNILNYLEELTHDQDFVEWCEKSWSNMGLSIAFYHSYANILYATIKALVDGYMRAIKVKCTVVNAMDIYERRLKETTLFLAASRNMCTVQ